MSRKGGYIGGSTIIRLGSDWFSYSDPKVNPTTGETRSNKIKRLQTDSVKAKQQKKKNSKKRKKADKLLNPPKKHARQIEEKRLAKIERNRARLAEQQSIGTPKSSPGALKQQERLSRVVFEKREKKKLVASKSPIKDATKRGSVPSLTLATDFP